ncbi:MAG: hypothetical protein PHQ95_04530 [Candidatus Gracilibacteria bacterium]|nr:hypothetical protein [Candidatus Gracilibacteria bacterium]
MELFAIIILFVALIFLGKEFLKKGRFLREFINKSTQVVQWDYIGTPNSKSGMQNIILSASAPFSVLIGFELKILGYTGYDPYGFISSDEHNQIIISTYLGKKSIRFRFLINTPQADIHISSTTEDQKLSPMKVYSPHWWQGFGFYG